MNKNFGDGTIFYEKSRKRWAVEIPNINTGKKSRKYFKLKKEAESFLKDIKYKDKPKIQKKEKTLNEIIYENLEMKMQIQQINEESYKRIKRTIKEIEKSDISYNNIKKITSGMIQEYYSTIEELSQSSINKIHEQFYQAFNYSIIKRYIEKNPMNNVKRAVSIR